VAAGWVWLAAVSGAAGGGCARHDPGTPEEVADAFAEAYFQRMDQEKAKEYTALGASKMLDEELRSVAQLRKEGYGPAEAAGSQVAVQRGESTKRDQRVRVAYRVIVKLEGGGEDVQDVDVELTQIEHVWKVVRVGVARRGVEGQRM
jgi:hypothetical protein